MMNSDLQLELMDVTSEVSVLSVVSVNNLELKIVGKAIFSTRGCFFKLSGIRLIIALAIFIAATRESVPNYKSSS